MKSPYKSFAFLFLSAIILLPQSTMAQWVKTNGPASDTSVLAIEAGTFVKRELTAIVGK